MLFLEMLDLGAKMQATGAIFGLVLPIMEFVATGFDV